MLSAAVLYNFSFYFHKIIVDINFCPNFTDDKIVTPRSKVTLFALNS